MKSRLLLLFLSFFLFVLADDMLLEDEDYDDEMEDALDDEMEEEMEQPEIVQPDFTPPHSATGALLFENFQDGMAQWTHSTNPEFSGRFKVGKGGDNPSIDKEQGLYVPREAQRYAIFGGLTSSFDFTSEKTFVVQYELRLHEPLQCGGAYIKLSSKQDDSWQPSDVTNETPYTVMFGPDKCGSTNKVHFIWRFQNPVTEKYEEHHLSATVSPEGLADKQSHLYTLVVRSDNSFEIFVDKESKKSGSLLNDFEPPLVPPTEIDDPTDSKPSDWVDEAEIPDPEAEKPEDWDEDAPREIVDPEAEKPAGWNDDAPEEIPDPDAQEPDDWDEEDDGEWEAPLVDNPACSVGCGPWEPPMIPNPDYKGKWYAPMIDNPDYIGEWKAKQIPNPEYFMEDNPFVKLDPVAGVTIDIWTMQKGTEYDNIYVGTSEDAAWELGSAWEARKQFQQSVMKTAKPSESAGAGWDLDSAREFLQENALAVAATAGLLLLTIAFFCCCGSETPEDVVAEQRQTESTAAEESAESKPKETEEKSG